MIYSELFCISIYYAIKLVYSLVLSEKSNMTQSVGGDCPLPIIKCHNRNTYIKESSGTLFINDIL